MALYSIRGMVRSLTGDAALQSIQTHTGLPRVGYANLVLLPGYGLEVVGGRRLVIETDQTGTQAIYNAIDRSEQCLC